MSGFFVPVIYGSVRSDRQGIKAARWVVNELRRRGMDPMLIDPMEYQLPMLDRMYKEYAPGTAPALMESLAKTFSRRRRRPIRNWASIPRGSLKSSCDI